MIGQTRISVAAWVATILGAIVLVPVFSGPFLIVSAFVCGIVTGTGVLLQHWRAPRLLVPVVQLLVLVEMIALLFLHDTMRYVLVPWKQTVLEWNDRMVDALDGINRFSAPLPPEPYFTLFAVGVIGLTGLLIHLIAVQCRQAAWAGLLLLMMYTVPAATVHGGLPALLFVPPALGYVILLSAEGRSRLARWGRRIGGVTAMEANSQVEASAAGQAGRRIGLTVIAVAALLPALLPTLPEGVLGNGVSGTGAGGGIGGTVSMGANPMLDMGRNLRRGEDATALTYTTKNGASYLRMTTLDQFDGRTWQSSPRENLDQVDGTMAAPKGLAQSVDSLPRKQYHISISKRLRSPFVPVPYPPRNVSIDGKWRYVPSTLDVLSADRRTVAGVKYNVTSYDLNPSEEQLRNAPAGSEPDEFTSAIPDNTPGTVRNLARQVTQAANGNHYLQAAALQSWFRDTGGFTYDTKNEDGSGMQAIDDFLFDSKSGYCEQFAGAMALMARTLGLPARVALGFLPGTLDDDKYVVTMHDMHAWPELYFEGIGWVPFEPTPALQTGLPPVWSVPSNPTQTGDPSASPSESISPEPSGDASNPNLPGEEDLPDGAAGTADTGSGWWDNAAVRWGTGAVAVLALALVPWLVRTLIRRRRFLRAPGQESVEGLWAEMRDTARDLGLDWSESATPRQAGAWLATKLPVDVRPQAIRMARAVEFGRYAGISHDDVDVRREAAEVRSALVNGSPVRRRWQARLLPRSWRWYLSRGTSEASDLLDQFDLGLARMRSILTPRRRSDATTD